MNLTGSRGIRLFRRASDQDSTIVQPIDVILPFETFEQLEHHSIRLQFLLSANGLNKVLADFLGLIFFGKSLFFGDSVFFVDLI